MYNAEHVSAFFGLDSHYSWGLGKYLSGLFQCKSMSEPTGLKHVILSTGIIQQQERDLFQPILCKPKLMPLKSVTLQRLEDMQKLAEEKLRQQQINTSTSETTSQ